MGCSQRGQGPGQWAVTDDQSAERPTFGTKVAHDLNEPIGLLLGCQCPHEYECGFSRVVTRCPRTKLGRVPSVWYHYGPLGVDSESSSALIKDLVADRNDQVCSRHESPP